MMNVLKAVLGFIAWIPGQMFRDAKSNPWQALLVIVAGILVYRDCRSHQELVAKRAQIADLAQRLATAGKTIEIKEGLYARAVAEVTDLTVLLDAEDAENKDLLEQLGSSGDKLMTLERLVIKWKKAYEGAVAASQTDVPGDDPDGEGPIPAIVRKRVDFEKQWGFIGVKGYTLTDPPEGYVTVSQLRPLKLTVGIARGTDKQWRAYVKSSEENVSVDIEMAAVDPDVVDHLTWRDRVWVTGYLGFGDITGAVDLSYHFDDYSVGLGCQVNSDSSSCGVSVGLRPFAR